MNPDLPAWGSPSQRHAQIRDTADLLPDAAGAGFWLVYGVEPRMSEFGAYANSDVALLHYLLLPDGRFGADLGPVVIFHPATNGGYFRPSISIDGHAVIHVTATHFDGTHYRWLTVASADARKWTAPLLLADFGTTPGSGRLISVNQQVMAIHDSYAQGAPGRFRLAPAGLGGAWSSERAFASEGLYHGGAFSVCATSDGALHLAYSDKSLRRLHYREWRDGIWSAATTIETTGAWSNQIGITDTGAGVALVWNRAIGSDHMRMMTLSRTSSGWSQTRVLDDAVDFKGYTSAIERIAPGQRAVALWSQSATSSSTGGAWIRAAEWLP